MQLQVSGRICIKTKIVLTTGRGGVNHLEVEGRRRGGVDAHWRQEGDRRQSGTRIRYDAVSGTN